MKNYLKLNKYLIMLIAITLIVYIANINRLDMSQISNQSTMQTVQNFLLQLDIEFTQTIADQLVYAQLTGEVYRKIIITILAVEMLVNTTAILLLTVYNKRIAREHNFYDYILSVIVSGSIIYISMRNCLFHLSGTLAYSSMSIAIINAIIVAVVIMTLLRIVASIIRNFSQSEYDQIWENLSFSFIRLSMFLMMIVSYWLLILGLVSSLSMNKLIVDTDYSIGILYSDITNNGISPILIILALLITFVMGMMRTHQTRIKYSVELFTVIITVILSASLLPNTVVLTSYLAIIISIIIKLGSMVSTNKKLKQIQS